MIKMVKTYIKYVHNPVKTVLKYLLLKRTVLKLKYYNFEFSIEKGRGEFTGLLNVLSNGWKIYDLKNTEYLFIHKAMKIKLIQPNLGALSENLIEEYILPVKHLLENKNVIDVGGFFGETAIMFKKIGKCRKVFVFEPVPYHFQFLKRNIILNNFERDIKAFKRGVCKKRGKLIIESAEPVGKGAFGLEKGNHKVEIDCVSWKDLIKFAKKNKVEIIKVDCEGCEEGILTLSKEEIKSIPIWIIEIHNRSLLTKLWKKFKNAGFKLLFKKLLSENIHIVVFSTKIK